MADREKVIKWLRFCFELANCDECPYEVECRIKTPENHCPIMDDILALLKEQEVRELTIDEWRAWKNNPKRDPICELWEHDTSPMWVLNPNTIHEPALLMGKLKLFTGKPTFEQCKAVKWND